MIRGVAARFRRSATTTSKSPDTRPTSGICTRPRRFRDSAQVGARRARRLEIVKRYDAALADLEGLTPIGRPDFGRHAHHLYVLRVDAARAGANRDRYAEALMAENISTGLHFLPVHTLTWYHQHLPEVELPVAQRAGSEVMSLPLAAAHSDADVDDVIAALHKVHAALIRP